MRFFIYGLLDLLCTTLSMVYATVRASLYFLFWEVSSGDWFSFRIVVHGIANLLFRTDVDELRNPTPQPEFSRASWIVRRPSPPPQHLPLLLTTACSHSTHYNSQLLCRSRHETSDSEQLLLPERRASARETREPARVAHVIGVRVRGHPLGRRACRLVQGGHLLLR